MEFRQSHNILIKTAAFGKSLKLTKNGTNPGENNIISEFKKDAPDYFKLRFL